MQKLTTIILPVKSAFKRECCSFYYAIATPPSFLKNEMPINCCNFEYFWQIFQNFQLKYRSAAVESFAEYIAQVIFISWSRFPTLDIALKNS